MSAREPERGTSQAAHTPEGHLFLGRADGFGGQGRNAPELHGPISLNGSSREPARRQQGVAPLTR
eukprot:15296934-Alexandrium_andersonii.AAC.1